MDPARWQELRHDTLSEARHRCSACSDPGPLECHEVWRYDDATLRQKLEGLQALCRPCHAAKTPGRLAWLENTGQVQPGALTVAIERIARLNGWTVPVAHRYVAYCTNVNADRGRYAWVPYAEPHPRGRDAVAPPQQPDEATCSGCFTLVPARDVHEGRGSCCR